MFLQHGVSERCQLIGSRSPGIPSCAGLDRLSLALIVLRRISIYFYFLITPCSLGAPYRSTLYPREKINNTSQSPKRNDNTKRFLAPESMLTRPRPPPSCSSVLSRRRTLRPIERDPHRGYHRFDGVPGSSRSFSNGRFFIKYPSSAQYQKQNNTQEPKVRARNQKGVLKY